jgi:hypothetical protein
MNINQQKRNRAILCLLLIFSSILFGVAFLKVGGRGEPTLKKSAFLGFKNLFSQRPTEEK